MSEIKKILVKLASDLPQNNKRNKSNKTIDLIESMSSILDLKNKGYSLYEITNLLQAQGVIVSYSLLKNTFAKWSREQHQSVEPLVSDEPPRSIDNPSKSAEQKPVMQTDIEAQVQTGLKSPPVGKFLTQAELDQIFSLD